MEPPSPPAGRARSGVLFEDMSDNDEELASDRRCNASAFEVFPVNKPPRRKRDTMARVYPSRTTVSKRRTTEQQGSTSNADANHFSTACHLESSCSHANSGVSGMAVNAQQIETPSGTSTSDLLDDRLVTDPDELYGENERALNGFMKLHPMLRKTSQRLKPNRPKCTLVILSLVCLSPQS